MEYVVTCGESFGELTKHVRELLKIGYIPQGGVAVYVDHRREGPQYVRLFQAMVRTTDKLTETA